MRIHVFLLGILAVVAAERAAGAVPSHVVAIEMEAAGNAAIGGRGSKCQAEQASELGKAGEWWIAVGEARPNAQGQWEAVGNSIRCGVGSRPSPPSPSAWKDGPTGSAGVPYLLATVSTAAALLASRLGADKVLQVNMSISIRKLADFTATQAPRYQQSDAKRVFLFADSGVAVLPLLIADGSESEAFKLHEVLVGFSARLAENGHGARYGALAIVSELDSAEILLDGGVVGTVSAGKETLVKNVLAGDREVSVRRRAGGAATRIVRVEANRTAMVSLAVSDTARAASAFPITPLGKNAQGYAEYRRVRDGAVMVRIPAGEFLMGNRESEGAPLEHKVRISEFMMDKTGVTWRQFKQFAGATGKSLPPNPPYWGILDDHPVVFVTWEEAKAYCEWSGARLPTEAEREKAARGTDGRKYPWGSEEPDAKHGVFRRSWGNAATEPVGTHPSGASPYGILDMGGNVWEFVSDWYDPRYYEVSPLWDPKGPRTGVSRVVRGGSWDSRPSVLSASVRNFAYRGYREGDFGFRCAMDAVKD